MNKWLDEEYEFEVEVTGYLRGDKPEGLCRNGEEIGDKYSCTYGCPVKDYDDALSVDGSHQKWRRSEKCGRIQQV